MMMSEFSDKPLVSIITPSYNQGQFIEQTILSVKNQSYPNIEHIIVDGGSTDDTLDVIKKYEGTYNMRWISEPDKGQADAVNKGFKMLKGEIVGWLNSDAVYFDTRVIARVVRCFNRRLDADIIYGDLALVDKNGLILKVDVAPGFSRRLSCGVIIPQPAAFFRNHVVQRHALDERLHYFMDYDFFLRLCADHDFCHFRSILAAQRHYPGRKTLAHKEAMAAEYRQPLRKYNLGVGVTGKAPRIWDRWCAGVPRRIDELIRIPSLSSSYDFAFPARLDSRWARFKRLARIDTDKLVEKLAGQSSLGDIRVPSPTETRSGEGCDHGGS